MTNLALPRAEEQPTVGLQRAALALGIGPTKAYELARTGRFPVTCHRIGGHYRISTAELRTFLELDEPSPAA